MPKAQRTYESDADGSESDPEIEIDDEEAEDMDMSEDSESREVPEVEDELEDELNDDEEDEVEVEAEDDADEAETEAIPSVQSSPKSRKGRVGQPRLRITLKIPPKLQSGSNSTDGTATPPITRPTRGRGSRGGRGGRRPALKKRVSSQDLEAEEEEEKDELESEEDNKTPEEAVLSDDSSIDREAAAMQSARLTQRQAAMVGGLEVSHVELEEGVSRKKKVLNASELALRREETARKRKNLSEKKLEDEKAETINRLLRKQSTRRMRKREANGSGMVTPANKGDARGNNGQEGSDSEDSTPSKTPPETTSYRWVSNASGISFSIPSSFLPSASLEDEIEVDDSTLPETDQSKSLENYNVNPHPARPPTKCSFEGCELMRKYRLVKNFESGACGMEHLKLLQARMGFS